MNSGILLIAAQRELRRTLFDALDEAGYPHIYSARDVSHAAILLEGRPSLQLVVVVFSGDEQQAKSCIEQTRYRRRRRSWSPESAPSWPPRSHG